MDNLMFEINNNLEIKTQRLIIRNFQPVNITKKYLNALNDNSIMGLTEARHQKWNREQAIKFILRSNKSNESILFGIFLFEKEKPIGNIRLFNFHKIHRRAELSFLFYDKEEWNKGYATEALKAIIEYAFEKLLLHRIHADYYESNSASEEVFKKLEFQIEGTYRDHFWLNDRYVDSIRVGKINSSSK